MSKPQPTPPSSGAEDDNASSGINLKLLYAIFAVALAAAIGLALLIVLPYYQRR